MKPSVEKDFVLCVDLDGVVADYTAAFRQVVAKAKGLDPATMTDQNEWEFAGVWGIADRDEYLDLHHQAVSEHRMFSTMPPIDGASDALWRLSDAGVHVRIVTHRLLIKGGYSTVVQDTVSWLQQPRPDGRVLIPYRDICFIGDKADVGGDMYIDDAPHNIEALTDAGFEVIIMDASYNRAVNGVRAYTWDDIERLVTNKLAWLAADPYARTRNGTVSSLDVPAA